MRTNLSHAIYRACKDCVRPLYIELCAAVGYGTEAHKAVIGPGLWAAARRGHLECLQACLEPRLEGMSAHAIWFWSGTAYENSRHRGSRGVNRERCIVDPQFLPQGRSMPLCAAIAGRHPDIVACILASLPDGLLPASVRDDPVFRRLCILVALNTDRSERDAKMFALLCEFH